MQGSEQAPKAPLGNNARPLQPLHHRTVRTNIDFHNRQVSPQFFFYNFMILKQWNLWFSSDLLCDGHQRLFWGKNNYKNI